MLIKLLKSVPADGVTGRSYGKPFTWPDSGAVACTDWNPAPACGGGLHAWIWDQSPTPEGCQLEEGQTFRVIEVDDAEDNLVRIDGKVKFREGVILGSYASIQEAVLAQGLQTHPHLSGFFGTSTSGTRGTSTSGDGGTSTSGDCGTSTSGDGGTSTSGYGGTSTSGTRGIVQSGYSGMVRGRHNAVLILWGRVYDESRNYYTERPYTAVVGQTKGIKANTWYKLGAKNRFVEVPADECPAESK